MTARNTTSYAKKLDHIRQKIAALQQEETKICCDVSQELSQFLIDAQALDVGYDTLVGGILDVIFQSKTDTEKAGAWQKSGQNFLKNWKRREREKGHGQED